MSQFPVIHTINDVLPSIKEWDNIPVIEKDGYYVVDYVYFLNHTFDSSIRRECRGLIFDKNGGRLISRPFHKFFNVGENEENMPYKINMSKLHVIQEKLDGSMVRPFLLDRKIQWATRKGMTEVAQRAEEAFHRQKGSYACREWIRHWLHQGYTPIFEYIGPENRIVVHYGETKIVFLALRRNRDGEYVESPIPYPGECVPSYASESTDILTYVDKVRQEKDREGDVLTFIDGARYKIKSEWYMGLNRVKSEVSNDRVVLEKSLDNTLDDFLSILPQSEHERVTKLCDDFSRLYHAKLVALKGMVRLLESWLDRRAYTKENRKEIATQFAPNYPKGDWKFIFHFIDGRDIEQEFDKDVRRQLAKQERFVGLMDWIGGANG